MNQGNRLLETEVARIRKLLAETDMSLPEIAERMDCSKSCVTSINRRFEVRHYEGKHSNWSKTPAAGTRVVPQ